MVSFSLFGLWRLDVFVSVEFGTHDVLSESGLVQKRLPAVLCRDEFGMFNRLVEIRDEANDSRSE